MARVTAVITFARVLDELIRICEEHHASRASISRYCILRDVKGKVRLVVEPEAKRADALDALEDLLEHELGAYFVRPILSAEKRGPLQRLANTLLSISDDKWPARWPEAYRDTLGVEIPIATKTRWSGIERTIDKEAWLSSDSSPVLPWKLVPSKTPPIVTFHSFKGGVGRTTLVAAFAVQLARGKPRRRIAVIDLDLEAPGIGALFGVDTERGVLDVLIDHVATDRIDLTNASASADLDGGLGDQITVFPAGRLDDFYIQKLARLDFSSAMPDEPNPVGRALTEMLRVMKPEFDIILLDSRAGLHDLAGMSLHGLAHVDVLVFRGTEQNFAGLKQTLRTLGPQSANKLVLVETMLSATDDEVFRTRRERTRKRIYRMFSEIIYVDESDEPPQPEDTDAPHDVLHVRRRERLDGLDSVQTRVHDILGDLDLQAVGQRIRDQCKITADEHDESVENEESEEGT